MRELGTNFDGAMAWIVDYHHAVATRFIEGLQNIPSFGPEADARLQEYLQSIANWPGGAESWSFESARYFGERGAEYQRSRRVSLLQKSKRYPQCRREKVHVHLIEHLAQPTS